MIVDFVIMINGSFLSKVCLYSQENVYNLFKTKKLVFVYWATNITHINCGFVFIEYVV